MNDPSRPLRLAVLYTVPFHSYAEDVAEDVVGAVKQDAPGLEVAFHDVAKMRLYICPGCKDGRETTPCRVNDHEDKLYKPDDQFVVLMDSVKQADIVLFIATVRAGGLNSTAQNLMERLECASVRSPIKPLKGKVAGVVLVSPQPNTWAVADGLLGTLNCYGAAIPPHGAFTVTSAGHPKQADEDTSSGSSPEDMTTAAAHDLVNGKQTAEYVSLLASGLVKLAKTFV